MSLSSTTITGDNIISLQNIDARDINIGLKEGIKPEIKRAKEENAELLAELVQSISILADEKEFIDYQDVKGAFEEINFDELILAIKKDTCVLFLGPEIAIDSENNSLHELFFKRISNSKRKYDKNEGLFMPGSEGRIKLHAMDYYGETGKDSFFGQNKIGNIILKKIAQIPFSLIISLSADNAIHRIYEKYNIKHKFIYYTGKKFNEEEEGNLETPIIYNALGNAAENGKYIYTHKQLDDYIKQNQDIKFPPEIERKIDESTHVLFLGLNFNLWHYRLLLFELNLLPKGEESHIGFAFKSKPLVPDYETFVTQQFKIDFINTNFQNFINKLLFFCKERNLIKSLDKVFVDNSLKELEDIRIKTVDADTLEKLIDLRNQLCRIKDKLLQFK